MVLARTGQPADLDAAEATLARLAGSPEPLARRDVAAAIGRDGDRRLHHILIALLYDEDARVAEGALASVRALGSADFIFVPTLVALLRHRRLKGAAREVLVGYGPDVVPVLAHFLRDRDEDIWVRRHIPATLARIPSQATMDTLVAALADEPDGFVRFKLLTAIERLRRDSPGLTFDRRPLESLVLRQASTYFTWLSLHHNLFVRERLPADDLLAQALREKTERAVNRIYVLLGILYPWQDVNAARWAIERGDPKARSSALEYLDNLLTGPIRKRVLPVLEDTPLADKVARGNALLSTRPRGTEETLLQLINDDDEIVAASAIRFVARQKLWTLADDLEHVVGHRDPNDWYVFEAASWALAEHRMPEERVRQLWTEPLPAVELAATLRHLPVFAAVSVDELFRVAGTGRQVRHEPGHVLGIEGQAAESLQILLEGTVEARARVGRQQQFTPPSPLGFDEVIVGGTLPWTLRTATRVVCLNLTVEECRTLLADNADLVQGLFRTLLEHPAFAGEQLIVAGTPQAAAEYTRLTGEGLSPIEKLLALQMAVPFSQMPADELLHLADAARRIGFKSGDVLLRAGATPAVLIVVDGRLTLTAEGGAAREASPGDIVGLLETLGGTPLGRDVTAATTGIALRIDHEEFFEILGERPALLRRLFARLVGRRDAQAIARA
jgi:CRP-like cAMP-binding protein/HEAT repeat protein